MTSASIARSSPVSCGGKEVVQIPSAPPIFPFCMLRSPVLPTDYMLFYSAIKFRKKEIVLNSRAIPPSRKKRGKKGRKLRKRDEREREGGHYLLSP
jgi:hypothetical protein